MEFEYPPAVPRNPLAERSYTILTSARTTASSLMILHDEVTDNSVEIRTDLLRATLLLSTAGLDSMVKQLIHDALPFVIATNEGARAKLQDYVDRRIRRDDLSGLKLVAAALAAPSARTAVVDALIGDLTSNSLQSVEELSRAVAFFDIPTVDVIGDAVGLARVFDVRNKIAHEMDVDFSQEAGHRIPRERESVVAHINTVFRTADAVLGAVDARLTTSA